MARVTPVPSTAPNMFLTPLEQDDVLESSVGASSTSLTPPTSLGDNTSEPDASKDVDARRSSRSRNAVTTYNDKVNAGTAVHTRRSFLKSPAGRDVSDTVIVASKDGRQTIQLIREEVKPVGTDWDQSRDSFPAARSKPKKVFARKSAGSKALGPFASRLASAMTSTTSKFGKRTSHAAGNARKTIRALVAQPKKKPASRTMAAKKKQSFDYTDDSDCSAEDSEDNVEGPTRRKPQFIEKGLYHGAERHNPKQETPKKSSATLENDFAQYDNSWLPLPMGAGQRLFEQGRPYKLPFNVLHPLPNDQAPKDWHRLNKNRFIGDAAAAWKKNADRLPTSLCVCSVLGGGCQEDCLNATMQYECNKDNCNAPLGCRNRAFAELKWRNRSKNEHRSTGTTEANMWGEGVEVVKTDGRGYGVRAMRSFKPGQIIVEYCGEIITTEEADRRMNEDYKGKTVRIFFLRHWSGCH